MGPFRLAEWLVDPRLGTLRREGSGPSAFGDDDGENGGHHGEEERLEPKVMAVLLCLASRAGEVVSKRELLDAVWPETHVHEVALSRSVSEIRRRLGDDARHPTFIETLPKRGYRLLQPVAPVTEGSAKPGPFDQLSGAVDPRTEQQSKRAEPVAKGWSHFWPWLALAVLVVVVGVVLEGPAPSVTVLPLQNLGGDSEAEYFAAGLGEDLVTQLWKIEGMKVKTPDRLAAGSDALEWAQAAGVTTVVEGSVRCEGDRLRISVRLVDVASHDVLWAETFNRDLRDPLVIQQDIARRVAAALVATRYQLGQWDEAGRWQDRP